MPKAYSKDLRERAVKLYKKLKNSHAVARQLDVTHAWVQKMVKLEETAGTLDTKYKNCGRKAILTEQHRELLHQWIKEQNDLTLKELQKRLAAIGVRVSETTIHNAIKDMKLTHKKNDRSRRKRPSRC